MRFGLWLAFLLVSACGEPTAPDLPFVQAADGQELIPQVKDAPPPAWLRSRMGPQFLAVTTGHFSMSCSHVGASSQCTLLWIGASATTALSIAECVGTGGVGCGFAVLSTAYTWQQYYAEPDCGTCRDPFGDIWHGNWYRHDRETQEGLQ